MNKEELKAKIVEKIKSAPIETGLAYSQLSDLEGFVGSCNLAHASYPLVRYWEGLSENAAEAITELIREGRVRHLPTDELAYLAQGTTLDYPVLTPELAKQASELKTPHWMPVLLKINSN